jgi:surfactin synthase thioesterase subunit
MGSSRHCQLRSPPSLSELLPLIEPRMHARPRAKHGAHPAAPFGFPITVFYGSADRRVTEAHVRGWARFTTSGFDCRRVEGHHLWPLQRGPKAVWLQAIADGLSDIAGEAAAAEAAAV